MKSLLTVVDNGRMLLEIRTYRLKPGTRDQFVTLMRREVASLMRVFGIAMIDCAGYRVDDGPDEAYVFCTFESAQQHAESIAAFETSRQWRHGPRDAVIRKIAAYHTIVVDTADATVRSMRSNT